ncbi:hypothetical protein BE11_27410 [Sorangium cellulosum]|nr:hypothetical protein BE11_27410 [Sorangium cellulosum]
MPTKRDLRTHRTRDELLALVARFELPVSDRRVRDQLISVVGCCKSATFEEERAHQHVLTPGLHVGGMDVEDEQEPFEERFPKLVARLEAQFAESAAGHCTCTRGVL